MKSSIILLLATAFFAVSCNKNAPNLNECVFKADSCYASNDFKGATNWYSRALKNKDAQPQHFYNAACCAAQAQEYDKAINFLKHLQKQIPTWYSRHIEEDNDLLSLHNAEDWDEIVATNRQRRAADEARYEHPLYEQLLAIVEEDQAVRQAFLQAHYNEQQELKDSLAARMHDIDSVHIHFVDSLLTERGWISREKVGDANGALWVVVQHYGLDMWKKYLPLFQQAVSIGELDKGAVAMLEDRISTAEGRPQRYGTQCYWDDSVSRFSPLADTAHIDSLRASVGLCPMSEYAKQMGVEWID